MARRWEIDPDAVLIARAKLGLRRSVEVKVTSQRKTAGRYKGLTGSPPVHRITISTHNCPSEAGKTLWHEMAHARQRERYRTQVAFLRGLEADDLEAEAESLERWNERIPLCRPS